MNSGPVTDNQEGVHLRQSGSKKDHPSAEGKLPHRRSKSTTRRLIFLTLYTVYILALLWAGLHFLLYLKFGIVPTAENPSEDEIWIYQYKELKLSGVLETDIQQNDEYFDVLLLGGSVLERSASFLEKELKKQLSQPIRMFNLAKSAHTSRDSYLKFTRVSNKTFDLIIVYHGINDVRMNCCAESDFRDDYSHCAWYNSLQRRLESGAIKLTGISVKDLFGFIPLSAPDEETLEYGRTIKTAEPFRENLEKIIELAAEKNPFVILMDFAFYIPENYSEDRFESQELDYETSERSLPIEVWGKPAYVAATIDAHNTQINRLAEKHKELTFVPQRERIPQEGKFFIDVCHLSSAGRKLFVDQIVQTIVEHEKDNEPGTR